MQWTVNIEIHLTKPHIYSYPFQPPQDNYYAVYYLFLTFASNLNVWNHRCEIANVKLFFLLFLAVLLLSFDVCLVTKRMKAAKYYDLITQIILGICIFLPIIACATRSTRTWSLEVMQNTHITLDEMFLFLVILSHVLTLSIFFLFHWHKQMMAVARLYTGKELGVSMKLTQCNRTNVECIVIYFGSFRYSQKPPHTKSIPQCCMPCLQFYRYSTHS